MLEVRLAPAPRAKLQRMCSAEGTRVSTTVAEWVSRRWRSLTSCPRGSGAAATAAAPASGGGRGPSAASASRAADGPPPRQEAPQAAPRSSGSAAAAAAAAAAAERRVLLGGLEAIGPRLRKIAGASRQLLATWTTGGRAFVSQALNFALSVRRHAPALEKLFVVVALDALAQTELRDYGFQTVLHSVAQPALPDAIWKLRWQLLLVGVQEGLELAVADSDVVVFSDPFPHFTRDADLEISTEHFWPERHLWKPWTRPEDDLSTGFIFARPSPMLLDFLAAFLRDNWEEYLLGGTPRDPFDQRVFNKFVRSAAAACAPCIVGSYGPESLALDTHRPATAEEIAAAGALHLRVLDPVSLVANGVNYFWRRAHKLLGEDHLPAVLHANGVGPKEYYLRDRGVWYVEDFVDRFGPAPKFLRYTHPQGLALAEDFAHLAAALEVARGLGRRLVLPDTMNCRNCPAFEPYGLNETLRGFRCTPDYFVYMFRLAHVHGEDYVEAGAHRDGRLDDNWGPEALLPKDPSAAAGALQQGKGAGGAALAAFEGDILALRDALRRSGRGWPAAAAANCSYHEWPLRFMACRDAAFVQHSGAGAPCEPARGQSGCGLEGLICCVTHHGRADRLEYYTGAKWDLPCNCGLQTCEEAPAADPGVRCCAGRAAWYGAGAMEGASASTCTWATDADPLGRPATNREKDLPFATSTALQRFADGDLSPEDVWAECEEHRRVYFLVREPLEGVPEADCNLLVSGYVVSWQDWQAGRRWWNFSLAQRRGPGAAAVPVSLERGVPDGLLLDRRKLRHDEEQLEFLLAQGKADKVPDLRRHAAALSATRRAHGRLEAGARNRGEVLEALRAAAASYNRALHTPDPDAGSLAAPLLEGAAPGPLFAALRGQTPLAVTATLLGAAAVRGVVALLRESTVWFTSLQDGTALEAQLRDGLHARALLDLAGSIAAQLPSDVAAAGLRDLRARSYEGVANISCTIGREQADAAVAVLLALGPGPATLRFEGARRGGTKGKEEDGVAAEALRMLPGDAAAWRPDNVRWHEVEVGASAASPEGAAFGQRPLTLLFLYGRSRGGGRVAAARAERLRTYMSEFDPGLFKYAPV